MFSANFSIDDNATAPDSSGEGPPMMIMDMNKYSSEIVAARVFVLVFGSLGLFGNTVSFLVSSKLSEKGKDSSGTVLMKCLAVADNLWVKINLCLMNFISVFFHNVISGAGYL